MHAYKYCIALLKHIQLQSQFLLHESYIQFPRKNIDWEQKVKASVLFAQLIFGILGGFFTIAGIHGQMTFRPSIWYSGPQPIVLAFIGLPLLAVAAALQVLHKRDSPEKELRIAVKCPECGHLNGEKTKFCGECGASMNPKRN